VVGRDWLLGERTRCGGLYVLLDSCRTQGGAKSSTDVQHWKPCRFLSTVSAARGIIDETDDLKRVALPSSRSTLGGERLDWSRRVLMA